jgi:hypothetical protein
MLFLYLKKFPDWKNRNTENRSPKSLFAQITSPFMRINKLFFERRRKMDEEIKSLLEGEIKTEIQDLSSLEPGSKEKSSAIEDLAKLYKLRIEETKNGWEYGERYDASESEKQLRKVQLEEQVKDRYFRFGAEVGAIVLPLIFYAIWMKKGLKFEETGTYTSTTFRGLFNRFRPTK